MTLPKPRIHFEALKDHKVPFLKHVLSLDAERRLEIINDPTGESCGLADFARSYSTTYSMTRLVLSYQWHHQQVVCVGPRMQEAFANTSLEDIPTDLIRLPHPCFYLATPESEGLVLWGGERTQWHKVAGCYVAKEPTANAIVILAWGAANEKSLDPLDDATFWFRLDLDRWTEQSRSFHEQKVAFGPFHEDTGLEDQFDVRLDKPRMREALTNIEAESKLTSAVLKEHRGRALVVDQGGRINIDHALSSLLSNRRAEASDHEHELFQRGQTEAHANTVKETARKLMRIVVNTILYMNASNAEVSAPVTSDNERDRLKSRLKGVKNPRKGSGKALQRKLDTLPKHRVVWVGSTIEQEVGGDRDFTSTGRRVSGHIRKGHWHTFLVGPRKIDGTPIPKEQRPSISNWIAPIWVGSLKDPSGPRTYRLREPQT
jgi:hypothetical protein